MRVLGSAGTYPAPGRPASGFLISEGSTTVWCEAGPGTYVEAARLLDPATLAAVVVSHQHMDHCLDVLTAFQALRYRPDPRYGLPLYGPAATLERLSGFLTEASVDHFTETFELRPVGDGDLVQVGDLEITFRTTEHSVPTVASRWTGGDKTVAFSADTGPGGHWAEVAEEVDLFLCEASYVGERQPDDYPFHLTAREAGLIASGAQVDRLVLTHLRPIGDEGQPAREAASEFGGPVQVAVPGAEFEV